MNKLRELTQKRAQLLKQVSEVGKEIDRLEQAKAKDEAFQKAMKYQ